MGEDRNLGVLAIGLALLVTVLAATVSTVVSAIIILIAMQAMGIQVEFGIAIAAVAASPLVMYAYHQLFTRKRKVREETLMRQERDLLRSEGLEQRDRPSF